MEFLGPILAKLHWIPPASAPFPSGARRTPCWARRWGENVQWGMKAWSGNRRRGDLPMVWLIWYTLHDIFFKFTICFIALMNFGETCHLKRSNLVTVWRTMLLLCCYHCDCMQQHYDVTQFKYVLWCHTMHEWVMNIHYKTWIPQERFTNIILTT